MNFWEIFFSSDMVVSQGAFVGTVLHFLQGDKVDRWKLFMSALTNYMSSIYITGLFVEQTGSQQAQGIAFLIGFFGFKLLDRVVDRLFDQFGTNSSHKNGNPPDPTF